MHIPTLRLKGLAAWASTCLIAFAASAQAPSPAPSWTTFAAQDDKPQAQAVPGRARLVFMRGPSPQDARWPADILIDGRYHASLLPGGFAEVTVCPGQRQLELAGQGTSGLDRRPQLSVRAQTEQTTYVLVQSPAAEQPLRSDVSAAQAQALLQNLRRQTHAVSRVVPAPDCPPLPAPAAPVVAAAPASPMVAAPAAPPPDVPRKVFTLSAEMLFAFGGSQPKHLSERGRREITALARQIKTELQDGEMLLVQGHTDPMGSNALNLRLSSERADTVRNLLMVQGIPANKVSAQGLGSSQTLVTGCELLHRKREDRIQCDQPNRRVEIAIVPVKK